MSTNRQQSSLGKSFESSTVLDHASSRDLHRSIMEGLGTHEPKVTVGNVGGKNITTRPSELRDNLFGELDGQNSV